MAQKAERLWGYLNTPEDTFGGGLSVIYLLGPNECMGAYFWTFMKRFWRRQRNCPLEII